MESKSVLRLRLPKLNRKLRKSSSFGTYVALHFSTDQLDD